MITVTIVDDNEDIRFGLQTLINSNENFNCEFSYGNGRDALDGLISNPTDVVLMDINMPLMNGIEAVKKLKELGSKSLFIMSTIYEDDENIFLSLKAGASGYILKKTPPAKLLEAIKGSSSKWVKTNYPDLSHFYWQDGYAAFSVSPQEIDKVESYIQNQHFHHLSKTFKEEYLEFLELFHIKYDPKYLWD